MGRRGPAPTPTQELAARGSWRAKVNPAEPAPETGEPARPAGLSKAAAKVWDELLPVLGPGVLTRDNGQTLARYCSDLVRYWKLAKWLEKDKKDGHYEIFDLHGNKRFMRHPKLITFERIGRDLMRMEQEFGLTPASRTRVSAVGVKDANKKPVAASGDVPVMRMAQ